MRSCLALILLLISCGPRAEAPPSTPAPPSARTTSGSPAPHEPPAATARTTPSEIWSCDTVSHPLVDFHHARLELRGDASFELRHTHTTPMQGWSSWVQGSWVREGRDVVLTPVSALRRVWVGDMHRQDHGEDVGAVQWEEPVSTAPWRLIARRDTTLGDALAIAEVGTSVFPEAAGAPCDAGPPPNRARPSGR